MSTTRVPWWAVGAAALGSSLLTITALLGYQERVRQRRRRALKKEAARHAPDAPLPHVPTPPHAPGRKDMYAESVGREQRRPHNAGLRAEGMNAIRNSFVIVVGAGGVGSWAALMLLRSGVGRLRLIDFDQVSLSSLTRHGCAPRAVLAGCGAVGRCRSASGPADA